MNFLKKVDIFKLYSAFIILYILTSSLFSRTGTGLYIFQFRLGEIAVGIGILSTLLILIYDEKNTFVKKSKVIISILLVSFILINIYYKSNFLDLYIFRSSTYIWYLPYLIIGIYTKKISMSESKNKYFYIFFILVYFFGIFNIEAVFSEFLYGITDKIEFHKGSEVVLLFVLFFFVHNHLQKRNTNKYFIFIFFFSIYLPFLMYKSRAAFIAILIFGLFEFYQYFININIKRVHIFYTILIFIILGTASTVVSQQYLLPDYETVPELVRESYSKILSDRYKTYNEDLPFMYFDNGRVFSADGNLNWRIQMWQDMFEYMNKNKATFIYGIGHNNIFPVFDIELFKDAKYRLGLDGLNQHLHNYFLTVFARGGLIHFLVLMYIYYLIYRNYFVLHENKYILIIYVSIFFVSFFDSSMENAHFPIIFYYFIGNQLLNNGKLSDC